MNYSQGLMLLSYYTIIILVYSLKCMSIPWFTLTGYYSSEFMPIYIPIIMYGLRLFIVVLQELQCLQCCSDVAIINVIGTYHFTKFHSSTASGF